MYCFFPTCPPLALPHVRLNPEEWDLLISKFLPKHYWPNIKVNKRNFFLNHIITEPNTSSFFPINVSWSSILSELEALSVPSDKIRNILSILLKKKPVSFERYYSDGWDNFSFFSPKYFGTQDFYLCHWNEEFKVGPTGGLVHDFDFSQSGSLTAAEIFLDLMFPEEFKAFTADHRVCSQSINSGVFFDAVKEAIKGGLGSYDVEPLLRLGDFAFNLHKNENVSEIAWSIQK